MKKIGNATLYCADCKDVLPLLKDIDSCVTDPPYGLSFMGKAWDYDVPDVEIWKEVFKTLKTGSHLLSFFGSRTYHRGAIPIEDAGFEIRDQLMWLYGSGFPKSHNIGKAVDKLQGNEREVIGKKLRGDVQKAKQTGITFAKADANKNNKDIFGYGTEILTKGNSEWEGWGTALKPAHEPIVMARKPFKGSVANNVLEYGTGGINIDECRVGINPDVDDKRLGGRGEWKTDKTAKNVYEGGYEGKNISSSEQGRFPANLMHDGSEVVCDIFPETNSRYFYCAKTSKKDRDEGLDALPNYYKGTYAQDEWSRNNMGNTPDNKRKPIKNTHPTVKPTELMRYLCRLVTPKGGVIVDPFMGSGSTGKAAIAEGFGFVGIELDEDYFEIACARIEAAYKSRSQELF